MHWEARINLYFPPASLHLRYFQEEPFIIYEESGSLSVLHSRRGFEFTQEDEHFQPNHVGSHTHFKNSVNNWVWISIILSSFLVSKFSLKFHFSFFFFASGGITNWIYSLFGTFFRAESQVFAKLYFYFFVTTVSMVYNSTNQSLNLLFHCLRHK